MGNPYATLDDADVGGRLHFLPLRNRSIRVLGMQLISVPIAAAGQVVAARVLGTENFGRYMYVLAWAGILLLFARFGYDRTSVRFISAYVGSESVSLLRGFLRHSDRAVLVASTATSIVLAIVVAALSPAIPDQLQTALYAATAYLPLTAGMMLSMSRMQALNRYSMAILPESVALPLLFIALIGILNAMHGRTLSAAEAMLCLSAATGLLFLFLRYAEWHAIDKPLRHTPISSNNRAWRKTAFSLACMSGFRQVSSNADIILLGLLRGPVEAGVFAVALRIASPLTFPLTAVNKALAPLTARLFAREKLHELEWSIRRAVRGVLCISLVGFVILWFAATPLLSIFGEDFVVGRDALLILAGGQLIFLAGGPAQLVLTMAGAEDLSLRVQAIGAVTSVALNVALIPFLGIIGAALAMVLSTALLNVLGVWLVRRRLSITVSPLVFARQRREGVSVGNRKLP